MNRCKQNTVLLLALALLLTSSIVACAKPAEFELVSLDVTPSEVIAGDTVSVIAEVRNIGGTEGVYTAVLTVDGEEAETKDIAVTPEATEIVTFSLMTGKAGTYQVAIGELSSSLTVKQKLVAKEVELKYDDGEARDSISFWAGGHIVGFQPPDTPFIVKTVKIAGGLYDGGAGNIEEIKKRNFDLEILDKDLKVIYTVTYPYDEFTSFATAWTSFELPDVEVHDAFYVNIHTVSPRYGLHIGADDSVVNEHSDVTARRSGGSTAILAQWPYPSDWWFGDKSKVNWMIRVAGTIMVPIE